jgi:hypothetical protein
MRMPGLPWVRIGLQEVVDTATPHRFINILFIDPSSALLVLIVVELYLMVVVLVRQESHSMSRIGQACRPGSMRTPYFYSGI